MRSLKTYFYILLLLGFNGHAQNQDKSLNSSYVLTSVSSIIPSGSPRYTLGYLYEFNSRWQIGLEFGYGTYAFLGSDSRKRKGIENDYKLVEWRPRINYILDTSSKIKPYVSSEFFYINQKDKFINDTESLRNSRYINNGLENDGMVTFYDSANFSRIKYGVNFNIGFLWEIWKKIGLNYNLGLGIRNRNIQYSNITNPSMELRPDSDSLVTPLHLLETGNQLGANFSFNIKLFYRLN